MATYKQDDVKSGQDGEKSGGKKGSDRLRRTGVLVLLLIAVASITIRMLFQFNYQHSSLLYVAVPFLISLFIAAFRPPKSREKWWHGYRDHLFIALIVFLGSSIVLFEGFICVLFFMPIYFLIASIGFLLDWFRHSRAKRKGNALAFALPVLILATSLEGTTTDLSFNRDAQVSVTKIANLTPTEIVSNMAQPFSLQKKRAWLISLFPMPYQIDAGSLNPGDVHYVHTRYHRWFAINTHEGELQLQIVDVEPNRVTTRFIHDSTFFASYLTVKRSEILLKEISPNQTEITLRIEYERKLDPAWYFHPLQQFGVGQMAGFLIDEVMIRDN